MKDIANICQLKDALKNCKVEFEEYLKELKAARKRTVKYSKYREFWQGVQHRMDSPFCYSREAEKEFTKYFTWALGLCEKLGLRCVTTK